jgi:hypothetical protein
MITDARVALAWIIFTAIIVVTTSNIEHETQIRTWLMLAATAACVIAWRFRSDK